MPKRKTPLSTEFPFHITARANNKETFPGDLGFIWKTLPVNFISSPYSMKPGCMLSF